MYISNNRNDTSLILNIETSEYSHNEFPVIRTSPDTPSGRMKCITTYYIIRSWYIRAFNNFEQASLRSRRAIVNLQ